MLSLLQKVLFQLISAGLLKQIPTKAEGRFMKFAPALFDGVFGVHLYV